MIRMAALAPKGIFEEEEIFVPACEETPCECLYDDFAPGCDAAA